MYGYYRERFHVNHSTSCNSPCETLVPFVGFNQKNSGSCSKSLYTLIREILNIFPVCIAVLVLNVNEDMKEYLLAKIKIQMHTYLSPPLLYDGPLVPLRHTVKQTPS